MKYVFLVGLFFLSACAENSQNLYCKKEGFGTPECQNYNYGPTNRKY